MAKVLGAALLALMVPPSLQTPRPPAPVTIRTDHVRVDVRPIGAPVAPGDTVSLVLKIEPRPRMHVYAPGATGYQIITVTIDRQPLVRLLPVQYPASEIYVFEPLQERVPVYQKAFTLTQRVILDDAPEALAALGGKGQLKLTGTLDYQACDDRICFKPVSVPVSWTVTVHGRGTVRPDRAAPPPDADR
jgi:hypothetical protein